jgi:excisionase family DNA binding protein
MATKPVRWLTVSGAATRLGITYAQVEELIESGALQVRRIAGDCPCISEEQVDAYRAEHPPAPSVGGGPAIGDTAEDDYKREKADYNEGDGEQ